MPIILEAFAEHPGIRVIVLSGAGDRAFVAGAGISQFEQQRAFLDAVERYEAIVDQAGLAITRQKTHIL